MRKRYLISLLLTLLGCEQQADESVTLRWKLSEGEQLRYSVSISEIPLDSQLAVHSFDVLNSNELREQIKHRLASITLPEAAFEAQLTRHVGQIQALVVGIAPDYAGPPADEDEAFRRRMIEGRSGYVELLGHFSKEGQLQDFFVRQKQRNLLNLLFSMPRVSVVPNTPWELDVTLTEIGPGFYFQNAERVRNAYLEEVDEVNGERVAHILYIVGERVDGYFKQHVDDDEVPIESRISHIAYGEFLIDRGRWAHFTMVAYFSGNGLSHNETMTIYAMRH